MSGAVTVEDPDPVAGVLACVVPDRPVARRLSLCPEDAGAVSVQVWLGTEDDGAQLEMIGMSAEACPPSMVTLGGLDVLGRVADAIASRFDVPRADAEWVEHLVMRAAVVGVIAVEAGGVEALDEFELQIRDRLAVAKGLTT